MPPAGGAPASSRRSSRDERIQGAGCRGEIVAAATLKDIARGLAAEAVVATWLRPLATRLQGFRLSVAQILISIGTCAVLEVAITAASQRVLMWPASALPTGNGVAFVLRVPGTRHGDWWSLHGAWIFAATAAVSLPQREVLAQ